MLTLFHRNCIVKSLLIVFGHNQDNLEQETTENFSKPFQNRHFQYKKFTNVQTTRFIVPFLTLFGVWSWDTLKYALHSLVLCRHVEGSTLGKAESLFRSCSVLSYNVDVQCFPSLVFHHHHLVTAVQELKNYFYNLVLESLHL